MKFYTKQKEMQRLHTKTSFILRVEIHTLNTTFMIHLWRVNPHTLVLEMLHSSMIIQMTGLLPRYSRWYIPLINYSKCLSHKAKFNLAKPIRDSCSGLPIYVSVPT